MMQKTLAKIISGIFNPLLMPTYGVLILFGSDSYFSMLPYEAKKVVFIIIFISTCLLPLAFIPLFLYQNLIHNFEMKSTQERIVPFATIALLYALGYFLLLQMKVPDTIANVILGGAITIAITLLITLRWKISAHMAGVGALTGTLLVFSYTLKSDLTLFLVLTILAAGLVGTSRMILKFHTPAQIYTGFGLGVAVLILTFTFF
jgi:membrane-associated phospholipid phosphatase